MTSTERHKFWKLADEFIKQMKWSGSETETERTLVFGNVHGFAAFLDGRAAASSPPSEPSEKMPTNLYDAEIARHSELAPTPCSVCGDVITNGMRATTYCVLRDCPDAKSRPDRTAPSMGRGRIVGPSKREYELRDGMLWANFSPSEHPPRADHWFPQPSVIQQDVLTVAELLRLATSPSEGRTPFAKGQAAEWVNRFFALKLDGEYLDTLADSLDVFAQPAEPVRERAKLSPQDDATLAAFEAKLSEPRPDYKSLYYQLLFAVGNKYPGETRHQTALRYIRQAETISARAVSVSEEPAA